MWTTVPRSIRSKILSHLTHPLFNKVYCASLMCLKLPIWGRTFILRQSLHRPTTPILFNCAIESWLLLISSNRLFSLLAWFIWKQASLPWRLFHNREGWKFTMPFEENFTWSQSTAISGARKVHLISSWKMRKAMQTRVHSNMRDSVGLLMNLVMLEKSGRWNLRQTHRALDWKRVQNLLHESHSHWISC